MLEWKRFFSPASDALIEQFEKRHGVVLPPRFRNYVSLINGGQPNLHCDFMLPDVGQKVMLGVLYSITDEVGNNLSIATVMAESNDDFPNSYIPIGEDPVATNC